MRKNLMRIASLVLAFALVSVSAFAALTGRYDAETGTYTVEGGATGLETSLIIVEGAHDELPIDNEVVTGAVYIDQVAAAENGAAFENVELTGEVYTAFFSNESEKSASSAQIVTASIVIAPDTTILELGESATISVNAPESATNVKFYEDDVEVTLEGSILAGYTYTPATAGTHEVKLVATVSGATVESNIISFEVTEFNPIVTVNAAVVLDDVYTVDEETAEVKNGEIVTPVYINVTLPVGALNQMKWVLDAEVSGLVCSETFDMGGINVSGDTTFAAVIKNGLHQNGVDNDHEAVTSVGAIFDIDDVTYFTSEVYQSNFIAE